jgi:membrane protein implicated in regulation of membrane protease activity
MNKGWGVILLGLILIAALVAVGPLLVIWSINTLFPVAAVPYDIWTWLAVIILFGAVRTNVTYKRKD